MVTYGQSSFLLWSQLVSYKMYCLDIRLIAFMAKQWTLYPICNVLHLSSLKVFYEKYFDGHSFDFVTPYNANHSLGPGTVGFGGESQSFFMVSAALCLALILCHTAWGVVTFHGYDERKYHYVAFVWAAHYLFSCLVS